MSVSIQATRIGGTIAFIGVLAGPPRAELRLPLIRVEACLAEEFKSATPKRQRLPKSPTRLASDLSDVARVTVAETDGIVCFEQDDGTSMVGEAQGCNSQRDPHQQQPPGAGLYQHRRPTAATRADDIWLLRMGRA